MEKYWIRNKHPKSATLNKTVQIIKYSIMPFTHLFNLIIKKISVVLWIRITCLLILMRFITLMRIQLWIRIWIDTDPDAIQIGLFTLARIQILASK